MSFTESLDDLVLNSPDAILGKHPQWERVRLIEVAEVLNGFAFPSSGFNKAEGVGLIRIRDIASATTETKFVGEFEPEYLVSHGDLLVGMDGDFNCAIWRGEPALLNQRVCKITCAEDFYRSKFLYYALPGYLQAINRATSSITVKHLSSRTVQDIPLPLPSIVEQDRIVAEIEKQFTRLDAATAALKRAQANLKRYRASVLKAACEGRLVPTHHASSPYEPVAVEKLLSEPLANGRSPQKTTDTGFKILRLTAIKNGRVDTDEWRLGDVTEAWIKNLSIKSNDIFISRGNGSKSLVGLAGLVTDRSADSEPVLFPDTLIRARLNPALCDARFFVLMWNSRFVRDQIERTARTTAGIHKISQTDIERFAIPLPNIEDQIAIVGLAERAFTMLDHATESLARMFARSSSLRASILASAFSGRLVHQDSSDEDASELLERIRTERTGATAQKSLTRRRKEPTYS